MKIVYDKKTLDPNYRQSKSYAYYTHFTVAEFPAQKRLIRLLYQFRGARIKEARYGRPFGPNPITRTHYIPLPKIFLCRKATITINLDTKHESLCDTKVYGWIEKDFNPESDEMVVELPLPNCKSNSICVGDQSVAKATDLFNNFWLTTFNFDLTRNTIEFFRNNFDFAVERAAIIDEKDSALEALLNGFYKWEQTKLEDLQFTTKVYKPEDLKFSVNWTEYKEG